MEQKNEESNMYSRLGKNCHEKSVLVDRAHHVLSTRNTKFNIKESGLISGRNKKQSKTSLDVKELFKYYTSMEKERNEAAEKKKKNEEWKSQEVLLISNEVLGDALNAVRIERKMLASLPSLNNPQRLRHRSGNQ